MKDNEERKILRTMEFVFVLRTIHKRNGFFVWFGSYIFRNSLGMQKLIKLFSY